jgi:tetratricopeptide (TPR) repeat protein
VTLIEMLQSHPWDSGHISLEPRVLGPDRQVGYDIAIPGSRRRLEVKLNPTREDVRTFLRTVADDPDVAENTTSYEFVHARGSAALRDLQTVLLLAREVVHATEFTNRSSELTTGQRDLVSQLSLHAYQACRRITVSSMPETHVDTVLRWRTDFIFGENDSLVVRDRLRARIADASQERATLDVAVLIDELNSLGFTSRLVQRPDLTALSRPVQEAIAVLALLDSPLPRRVLQEAIDADDASMVELERLAASAPLVTETGVLLTWRVGGVHVPRFHQLLSEVLRSLLRIASDRNQHHLAVTQVRNIARLAVELQETDPELVADSYRHAEKVFKTRGNLQLALSASRVALRASERPPLLANRVTDEQLRARAQTLICGESWVLQRTGDLDAAERLAQQSLQLGEKLGWDRNTAFRLKCLGRLQRLRAEQEGVEESKRRELLGESERLLLEAARAFAKSDEFGPGHPEIGDCKSLLARTLMVAGRRREAWDQLLEAESLLETHVGQKDWVDALILEGELLHLDGAELQSLARIDEALTSFPDSPDSDVTEITARALALRGKVGSRRSRERSAADHERSAQLYEELEDYQRADDQRWAAFVAADRVPPDLSRFLDGERNGVRVAAVLALEDELAASAKRSVGRRTVGLTAAKAKQLLARARLDAERREHMWR